MKRTLTCAIALALLASIGSAKRPKIKPQVTYATSWAAAVEEAKLLNVPIVVHSHGFY